MLAVGSGDTTVRSGTGDGANVDKGDGCNVGRCVQSVVGLESRVAPGVCLLLDCVGSLNVGIEFVLTVRIIADESDATGDGLTDAVDGGVAVGVEDEEPGITVADDAYNTPAVIETCAGVPVWGVVAMSTNTVAAGSVQTQSHRSQAD
jgi:hypothetical protein